MSAHARVAAAGRWLYSSRNGVAAVAQTIVARFLLAALNVCTGVITARGLGADGRGAQSAMMLWPALICYVLTLGFPSALRFRVRREPDRAAEFLSVSILAAIALSFIAIGVGWLLIPLWMRAYPAQVVHDAQAFMFFAPEVMLGLVLIAMLEALGDFTTANTVRYISVVVTLAWLVLLALTHTLTPFWSTLSYLVPPVFTTAWMAWKLRRHIVWRRFDLRPGLRTLGSYGFRSYGIDILATLSTQVDQFLVIGLLNAGEMGVYAVSLAVSRVPQILHSAVVAVVFPSASGLADDEIVALVGRAARISTIIAFAFCAVLAALTPVLVPLVYGHAFDEAVRVAQLLTLEALIGGLAYVLSQTFMALGRPGFITVVQAIGLAAAVPAMVLLVPRFGLIGAATGLLLSTCIRLGTLLLAFPLVLKRPIPRLLPDADDVKALRRALPQSAA